MKKKEKSHMLIVAAMAVTRGAQKTMTHPQQLSLMAEQVRVATP